MPSRAFQPWRKRDNGFSFIELVVVLAILSVLAAIGLPALRQWVPNYQLKAATQELYGNLQKARMEAIKTNSTVSTVFDTSTCTAANGGNYTFTNDESGERIAAVALSGGICLTTGTISGFNSRGLPRSGAGGSAVLENDEISRTQTITQTIAGNIRIK
ncbi:MAG: GspH/FimT family pseudopilin [Desulfopila sp.]